MYYRVNFIITCYCYYSLFYQEETRLPVLFRQVRPGFNGKPFEMIKFRTMRDAVDKDGNALPDEERMTDLVISYVIVVWMNYLNY